MGVTGREDRMDAGREAGTGRPLVIGHRGFRARYPENGLEGVRAALEAGADGVEVDVRPTADGLWVCHHDLKNRGLAIVQHRWRELGRWGVASLEAVLEAIPDDRWLYLEIKPVAVHRLDPCLETLAGLLAHRRGRLRLLSSSPGVLKRAAGAVPQGIPSLVIREARYPAIPGHWTLSPHHRSVEQLLATGRALHPWTVNSPNRARELASLGIPSLTTDDPVRLLEALEAPGARSRPGPGESRAGEDRWKRTDGA